MKPISWTLEVYKNILFAARRKEILYKHRDFSFTELPTMHLRITDGFVLITILPWCLS